jgi:uncharacterized protein (UPF0548 family)
MTEAEFSPAGFTYDEVGATRTGVLPDGFAHLRHRVEVGPASVFGAAGEAILTWQLHRRAGVGMRVSAPRAAPGVEATTTLGIGRIGLTAPCRVIWVDDTPERAGFGYGTVAGHPVRGEEAFTVEIVDGRTFFAVTAFSRPAAWYTRAAGPVLPLLQRQYVAHLGRVLHRHWCRLPPA